MDLGPPPYQPKPSNLPQKSFPYVTLILSIIITVLTASTAFLAYQNMQLKQQLTVLNQSKAPTPTPIGDPTTNWNTYTNEQYKISFRYPNDLIINDIQDSPRGINNSNVIIGLSLIDPKTHVVKIMFTIHKSNKITDLPPNVGDGIVTKVNDLEITTYATSGAFIPDQKFIRITGEDRKIYQFSYTQSLKDPKLIDQILSTFKFLDKATSIPCGGIAGTTCPAGYVCEMTAMYPDASGTCTKKESYTCPKNGYVDCMPSPNSGIRYECTSEAMNWYKANCSDFKGGAL